MVKTLITEVRTSLIATLVLAILLCGIYPLIVWITAQMFFDHAANGSLLTRKGVIIGSSLIAQRFDDEKYFHPRPSAAGQGYDAAHSGGSNLGPLSKNLIAAVKKHVIAYRAKNGLAPDTLVPADAVTASGSGLDPHISVKNALLQARRVAQARGMREENVLDKIKAHTERRDAWVLGEPRVNVFLLNLALDE
jgi:K+-transporting ATPase ATPase C chain